MQVFRLVRVGYRWVGYDVEVEVLRLEEVELDVVVSYRYSA